MKEIIIFGGSGHAKVIADIIKRDELGEIIGVVDNGGNTFWEYPLLGMDDDAGFLHDQYPNAEAFVAIGNNEIRCKVAGLAREKGFTLTNVVSRDAIISPTVRIESFGGVAIMPGAVINADVSLGEGCIINTNASVDHEVEVGNYAHISPGCAISGGVVIGEKTWIGTGTRIIENIKVGKLSVVGAGATVVEDLQDNVLAVGVPARIVKTLSSVKLYP